jgi:kynurenine formamidase
MNRYTWYTAVLPLAVPLVYPPLGSDRADRLRQALQATKAMDLTQVMHENMPCWFAAHVVMLGANKYMVENMANLDAPPPTGATILMGGFPV